MLKAARFVAAVAVLCACTGTLHAQPHATATLAITTNYPQAVVYVDSVRAGLASQGLFQAPATAQELTLVAESGDSWTITPVVRELDLVPDSTYRIRMDFPYHYLVRTIPYGATVYLEAGGTRRRIGETPLLYTSEAPLDSTLVVESPGYVVQRISPGAQVWSEHELVLDPLDARSRATEITWKPPAPHRHWIDYAALGLAVAAGVMTVHYKFKADGLYERYEQTGDPALRPEIQAYDMRAGIALGAMQVGVGVLAVRFILHR